MKSAGPSVFPHAKHVSLDEDLRRIASQFLTGVPRSLRESILYSLTGPGKRIRPRIVLAVAHALKLDHEIALRLGVALEMTHAYTLVHDDLPAMDNDDFRRGQPTNHKVFGEATALLAGDSLALLACDAVLSVPSVESTRILSALRILLDASGARGVIAGQAGEADLAKNGSLEALLEVFRLKTGALFRAALTLPIACDSSLSEEKRSSLLRGLGEIGDAIGIAFQIADDLEDDFTQAKTNPAHIASYLKKSDARKLAKDTLAAAFGKIEDGDPASLEFRIREELHPFFEELEKKLG